MKKKSFNYKYDLRANLIPLSNCDAHFRKANLVSVSFSFEFGSWTKSQYTLNKKRMALYQKIIKITFVFIFVWNRSLKQNFT